MDSHHQPTENCHKNVAAEKQIHQAPPPFATASFSPFTAAQHATHSFRQDRISSLLASPRPTEARFPNQVSSVAANLSLSASTRRISFESAVSPKTLTIPGPSRPSNLSTLDPHRPLDPPGAAGLPRGTCIVWFRRDLRVHDNECLNAAHNESMSVLPVYFLDPRRYCKSDLASPYRASKNLGSVFDLRRSLRDRGSDLVVRVGRPEEGLPEMVKAVGAKVVYAHREVSRDEVELEERIEAAMKEEGVEVKYFWGATLLHIDDLPFKVGDMPTDYDAFWERVQGVEVRKPIAALDQLKGLPKRGHVEPGEMPSLYDLGLTPSASMAQVVEAPPEVGGESEALQRLKKLTAGYQTHHSPFDFLLWLSNGCLSPRAVFEELKNVISAASKNDDGGSSSTLYDCSMDQLMDWDFHSFYDKKYSLTVKQGAPAGTDALV